MHTDCREAVYLNLKVFAAGDGQRSTALAHLLGQ